MSEEKASKGILVTLPPKFIEKLDEHWKKEGHISRSAYIAYLARRDMEQKEAAGR